MKNENKNIQIPEKILKELLKAAKEEDIERLTLFGSRARRTNHERSDIDLAVKARDKQKFNSFAEHINELDTLLMFDIVNQDGIFYTHDLADEIKRDGVVLYEKI